MSFLLNVHLGEFALQDFLVSSSFLENSYLNLPLVWVSVPEPRFGCSQVTRGSIKSKGVLRDFGLFVLTCSLSFPFFLGLGGDFFLGSNKISKRALSTLVLEFTLTMD